MVQRVDFEFHLLYEKKAIQQPPWIFVATVAAFQPLTNKLV